MFRPLGVLLLIVAPAMRAQSFEVASVKVHPEPPHIIGIKTSGPRLHADAEMVGGLIMYAYNLQNYQLSLPNVAENEIYYDIEAKAEGDAAPTKDQFRQMLQTLLADRFKLKFHHEMRELPVLALAVAKNGPKFQQSAPDTQPSGRITMNGRNQVTTLSKSSIDDFVSSLSVYAGRPVLNKTGLSGTYDIKLEATPFFRINNNPDPADISVFDAVQQQLGLKLEAQKAMVDVLVIDHLEKPSGN
jgi:uncharacterized protein (TIGR03435 family)